MDCGDEAYRGSHGEKGDGGEEEGGKEDGHRKRQKVFSFLWYLYFSLVCPGQMKAQLFYLHIWKHTYKMPICNNVQCNITMI